MPFSAPPLSGIAAAGLCPATPLVLILPLAILLFRRTFREVVVAAAGLILPVLTACYVSWGAGRRITAPVTALADAVVSGVPLWIFTALPLPSLVMLLHHCSTRPDGALFLSFGHLCRRNQAAFILIFNIGILAMTRPALHPVGHSRSIHLTAVPPPCFPVLLCG